MLAIPEIRATPAYTTGWGRSYCGDSRLLLEQLPDETIDLVMTSPPFALLRTKEYGNIDQANYIEWLAGFAQIIYAKLKPSGSFVLDLGGAYQQGYPVRSLYNFRIPIYFCDNLGFHLAEDFYWFNPAKLPSPIEWVNKRKMRAKDAVNTVWWFSKSQFPKANVTNVLVEYGNRMKKLLKDPNKFYSPAKRPSGHDIGESFGRNGQGAIPSNLLQISNTESNSQYISYCRLVGAKPHPARFPAKLPEFFIRFLTDPEDLVVDIFAGSNTTGWVAESNSRHWLAMDNSLDYVATSHFRFLEKGMNASALDDNYRRIRSRETVSLEALGQTARLLETEGHYATLPPESEGKEDP